MALILADRVQETTTVTGTGTATLLGAVTGYQSFAVIGNGNTTYYCIAGQTSSEWEVGIGTYTSSGTTLARTTVLASSNSGSLVSFSAGTKNVFVTYPSEKSVNQDGSGNVILTLSPLTSSNTSALQVGATLSFSDTGIISDFVATLNGYTQVVTQNKSNGAAASAEFIAYNDAGTASTNYATVGINSSGYTGTGAINAAGYSYFLSGSTDLVLGTVGANNIHFVTNSQATDAVTINTSNAVAFNGSYGTTGQVLTSAGSGAPPTWSAASGSAYTRTSFTATAGQTAFTVTYAVGYLQVYVNGVLLATSDYTATSGTGFTLSVGANAGDIVDALVITTSVVGITTGKSIAMAMIFGY
jgi:hypothetical protein